MYILYDPAWCFLQCRNVLKATVDVPQIGEVNFHCTHLDHLDENWRMKQMNAIIQSNDHGEPHILAGALNSLDETDYSSERWTDIVKVKTIAVLIILNPVSHKNNLINFVFNWIRITSYIVLRGDGKANPKS